MVDLGSTVFQAPRPLALRGTVRKKGEGEDTALRKTEPDT